MLAFAILHVIGDPVLLLLPLNAGKEEYERYHKLLGLDKPVYVQYWKFASRAVQGDFGKSWYTDTPAFTLVLERMPPTLYLTSAGLVAALLIALPLGILAALKRHSLVDNLCTMLAVAGQAMPIFWLGIMLIIIFAVRLKALPASGYGTWQHFLMPAFTLGAFLAPLTMRLVRSGVIEMINMDYIRTARAKGVRENTVVVKPAFRTASLPIITVLRLPVGRASHRVHRDDRRTGGVGSLDLALGPALGGHPAPAGPAGLDGRRDARARAGHRPGGARPALARDLLRARVVDHRRGRCARVLEHRRAARPRRGLLRRTHGLDHHDAGQRHAHVPLRAARPRRHRRARAEPRQHDHRARHRRLAAVRAGHPRGDAGHPGARVHPRGPRARHEPRAPRLPPDPAEPRLGDRRHRHAAGGPRDHPGVVPVVPGPGRAAADAGVGQHARRGARLHAQLVVDRHLPRPRDLRDHPGHQPDGQRAARLARPPHEAVRVGLAAFL